MEDDGELLRIWCVFQFCDFRFWVSDFPTSNQCWAGTHCAGSKLPRLVPASKTRTGTGSEFHSGCQKTVTNLHQGYGFVEFCSEHDPDYVSPLWSWCFPLLKLEDPIPFSMDSYRAIICSCWVGDAGHQNTEHHEVGWQAYQCQQGMCDIKLSIGALQEWDPYQSQSLLVFSLFSIV